MLKKISISLFLLIYFSASTVSFADEVVIEVLETVAPVAENGAEVVPMIDVIPALPEVILESEPIPEVIPSVEDVPVTNDVPTVESISDDVTPPEIENDTDILSEENTPLDSATEELGITEEIPLMTEEVLLETPPEEVIVISEPPAPEPEPWQPTTVDHTLGASQGQGETQSNPVFLAENSVFIRRIAENVVIDPAAKHTCKVDIFRTDISDINTSTLSVKFYGTSLLASYDAEIGSLPNGIDVRFEKNNDYLYDFRGKETALTLVVNKQDGSLSGDFTIPIIFTHKGKNESAVICQLNLINEEEEPILAPVLVPVVEPILDPAQVFVEAILDIVAEPEPVIEMPIVTENILEIVTEQNPDVLLEITPPIIPPHEILPVALPEIDEGTLEPPLDAVPPPEPVVIPDPALEIVTPVIENNPVVESAPIPLSDVSST